MTDIQRWMNQATCNLSKDSAARVRTEIQEHHEAAREAAIQCGANPDEADRLAVAGLGDAKIANAQYRQVLLTAGETRLLREGNWEARAICSWRKWALLPLPLAALYAAITLFRRGEIDTATMLLAGALV